MSDVPGLLRLPTSVRGYVLDLPPLQETHLGAPGIYVGVEATDPDAHFSGAVVFWSDDAGTTWRRFAALSGEVVAGVTVGALGGGVSGTMWDTVNVLTVVLNRDQATLASEPEEAVARGRVNWILVGQEIVAFKTATLIAERTYQLTNLLRGRRNTEEWINNHPSEEAVVLLTRPSTVEFVEVSWGEHYQQRLFKTVPVGRSVVDVPDINTHFMQSKNMLPFSPTILPSVRNAAGDLTIRWLPRTRHLLHPLGAIGYAPSCCCCCEEYEVDVWNVGRTTVLRTFRLCQRNEFIYTAAKQVVDFGSTQSSVEISIYHKACLIGRGRPAEGAV